MAGGWSLNGIVQVTDGQPFTVTTGKDTENIGCCWQQRMDVTGDPNSGSGLHTQQKWFNTSAFTLPAPYTYGNQKVNTMVSQHYNNVDMSIFRQFPIGLGEERYFEFRAEAFNMFNNVVFTVPDTNASHTNFGQTTAQRTGQNGLPAHRQLQVSLKFYY